jgi:hypothetical protein
MTDMQTEPQPAAEPEETVLDIGGLQFTVAFRGPGATIRVYGEPEGVRTELLRFDDFIEDPHYHVPASAKPFAFDRAAHGAPLPWFIEQIRDHLGELLSDAGYASVLGSVDLDAVREGAGRIEQAMVDCVPAGFTRVAGVGIQPV